MTAIPLSLLPAEAREALARGERVDVLDGSRPVASLEPAVPPRVRRLGAMAGTVLFGADSLLEPLDEPWEALEGPS